MARELLFGRFGQRSATRLGVRLPARPIAAGKRGRISPWNCLWVALLGLMLPTISAHAQDAAGATAWQLCNRTSYIAEIAIGRAEGEAVMVKGWMRIRPGECRTVLEGPLKTTNHYLYARSSSAHSGGVREWGGDTDLCVSPRSNFEANGKEACREGDRAKRAFRSIAIGRKSGWRTFLTLPGSVDLTSARIAGIQRLLNDAGYTTRETDGVLGLRSQQALQRFKADAKLPDKISDDQLIDALEKAARDWNQSIGLTLCNRTSNIVWAAIARQRGEGWESRGWWRLGPGTCAKTLNEALAQPDYYVRAIMETDQGDEELTAASETFCVAASRFVIPGRSTCSERQFETARFALAQPKGQEAMLIEFFDRNFVRKSNNVAASQNSASGAPSVPAQGASIGAGSPAPSSTTKPPAAGSGLVPSTGSPSNRVAQNSGKKP